MFIVTISRSTRHSICVMLCFILMNISGTSDDTGMARSDSAVALDDGIISIAVESRIITMINRIATRARPLSEYLSDRYIAAEHMTITVTIANMPIDAPPSSDIAEKPLGNSSAK